MSKTIELKQQEELSNTTDKKNYSSELEFIQVENTPFTIVRQKKEYFGLIGEHRITDSYETLEEIEKIIKEITWDRIVQVIWAITEKYNKIKLEKNE